MGESLFSTKIRALRKSAGYTQEEISHKLNIQRQTYCNYENSLRTPPMEIIVSLAEMYHVTVDSLVRDTVLSPVPENSVHRNPDELKLVNEFSSLSGNKQKEVLEFIRFKKQFSD